jgi:hypothetical protein
MLGACPDDSAHKSLIDQVSRMITTEVEVRVSGNCPGAKAFGSHLMATGSATKVVRSAATLTDPIRRTVRTLSLQMICATLGKRRRAESTTGTASRRRSHSVKEEACCACATVQTNGRLLLRLERNAPQSNRRPFVILCPKNRGPQDLDTPKTVARSMPSRQQTTRSYHGNQEDCGRSNRQKTCAAFQ